MHFHLTNKMVVIAAITTSGKKVLTIHKGKLGRSTKTSWGQVKCTIYIYKKL